MKHRNWPPDAPTSHLGIGTEMNQNVNDGFVSVNLVVTQAEIDLDVSFKNEPLFVHTTPRRFLLIHMQIKPNKSNKQTNKQTNKQSQTTSSRVKQINKKSQANKQTKNQQKSNKVTEREAIQQTMAT